MSNFDFLLKQNCFSSFATTAITAEKLATTLYPNSCISTCRKAVEQATSWLYSVDRTLTVPADTSLVSLLGNSKFRKLVGNTLNEQLYIIRKIGNDAVHGSSVFKLGDAIQILNFLFNYLDWIDQNYGSGPSARRFSATLIINAAKAQQEKNKATEKSDSTTSVVKTTHIEKNDHGSSESSAVEELPKSKKADDTQLALLKEIERLKKENSKLSAELNANKQKNAEHYEAPKTDISEADTRKFLIDNRLKDAGWTKGVDWKEEVPVNGMPNASGKGYADYVLYGDDGKALAIIEAKKASVDPASGRHQALLYREALMRADPSCDPVIFLTNGHEIRLNDGLYPERLVSSFFSKEDLVSRALCFKNRKSFKGFDVSDICGRYYQIEAVKSVCSAFEKLRRKALLVMATGSGKTRTVLGLIKVLTKCSYVKNVLFLADRTALVDQAFATAKTLLKDYSLCNLSSDHVKAQDKNPSARLVFSTYPALMSKIDEVRNKNNVRIFTPGHFDLIICDEAHRSIYNRYQAIFEYFDSYLVGLTATPKEEIDRNTYKIFDLDDGAPTYYYSFKKAVEDDYLVDYHVLKINMHFLDRGIKYSELSKEDKLQWEETFGAVSDEEKEQAEIKATDINKYVFNLDTIKQVIDKFMDYGLKLDDGDRIGKTIIFARNHKHAEKVKEVFDRAYPNLGSEFCQVIDNHIREHDHLIEKFKTPSSMPQIAVSVDMLDTGIDVPECLNLVFFKPVWSHAKFWQMIGRGTRKCPKLIDGEDKKYFLIFDVCSNFTFFEQNENGIEGNLAKSLEERSFLVRLQILQQLQRSEQEYAQSIKNVAKELSSKIKDIPLDSFKTLPHTAILERYSSPKNFLHLSDEEQALAGAELGPLLLPPSGDDIDARRFDVLIFALETAFLDANKRQIKHRLIALKNVATILYGIDLDDIRRHKLLLDRILDDKFIDELSYELLEEIRQKLRDLCKYIDGPGGTQKIIVTDFTDNEDKEHYEENYGSNHATDTGFEPYHFRVERYLRSHRNEGAIAKIYRNEKLNTQDIDSLEKILWKELGSYEEFHQEYPNQDLGILVRKIVGLDRNSANQIFANFFSSHDLNEEQSNFVKQVVNYVVENGLIENNSELMSDPFNVDLIEIFGDDSSLLSEFLGNISNIKLNAQLSVEHKS